MGDDLVKPVGIDCLCFFVSVIQGWINDPGDEWDAWLGDDMEAFSRVHAHVRARRAWRRLRIRWGVRSLHFAWHERHATTPDQMDMAAELAAATEMLALEKDSAHNSRLVSELRARDDEHAKTMEAREKELAEKHAALLAELRSSLTAAHEAAMAETLGQHEEQRATQQRRHESELASRHGDAGSRERS